MALYVQGDSSTNTGENVLVNNFLTVGIGKSQVHIWAYRRYGNLKEGWGSDAGFISIFVLVIAFLTSGYTAFNYNLQLSKQLLYEKKDKPIRVKPGFINYLYNQWACCMCWFKKNENTQNPKEEVQRIMKDSEGIIDITAILKRISFLEKSCVMILGENRYNAIKLQQPYNLDQHKQMLRISDMHRIISEYGLRNEQIVESQSQLKSENGANSDNPIESGVSIPSIDQIEDKIDYSKVDNSSRPIKTEDSLMKGERDEEKKLTDEQERQLTEALNSYQKLIKNLKEDIKKDPSTAKLTESVINAIDKRFRNQKLVKSRKLLQISIEAVSQKQLPENNKEGKKGNEAL